MCTPDYSFKSLVSSAYGKSFWSLNDITFDISHPDTIQRGISSGNSMCHMSGFCAQSILLLIPES